MRYLILCQNPNILVENSKTHTSKYMNLRCKELSTTLKHQRPPNLLLHHSVCFDRSSSVILQGDDKEKILGAVQLIFSTIYFVSAINW